MLDKETFRLVVRHAPLFAMDLVVVNEDDHMLVGQRLNAPAKGWWFVPGGRVFKDETLDCAFERISRAELGRIVARNESILLGVFEHFYSDSLFGNELSTHYVNATHFLRVNAAELDLPYGDQHKAYRWVKLTEVGTDESIHQYSKVFMPSLLNFIKGASSLM